MCDAYSARGVRASYTCATRVRVWLRAPCTRGVHVDTRVNTVERRALTVRDLNLNLMQIRYSATDGSRCPHGDAAHHG